MPDLKRPDWKTKAHVPHFPRNRDDEQDFYDRGFEHGRKGWNACPPNGKE